MLVGLKFFPNTLREFISSPRFEEVLGMIDFIELTATRGEDFTEFGDFPKPIAIHCMHSKGKVWFNPANPAGQGLCKEWLDFAIKTADKFGSGIIVVHPGVREEGASLEAAGRFLAGFKDDRIRLETMPVQHKEGKEFFGRTPEEMRRLLELSGKGLCLDLCHSSESSIISGKGGMDFIREFLEMGPDYFHISNTIIEGKRVVEFHQHMEEGSMDMAPIRDIIPEGARVCLETPLDLEGRIRDIRFLRGEET